MYTSNEKSTGLDVLTALAAGDLIIVGDVSDSGRAKAITETNFESTTGITQLKTDVTQLQADVTTIQGDITTINGDINNLQSQINNIAAGGSGGSGKPMTFALTDFGTETGLPLNGYSDTEALVYVSGSTVSFQDILGFTQSRDLTLDWASATGIQGYVVLGSYLYVLVSSGSVLRVYRFSRLDLSLGGTLMTFSGATLTYNANVTMTSNGTDFFFNYDVGQSANSYSIAKLTLSGTTLTYVAAVNCGATALQFTGKLAVDESGNIYGTTGGIFYQYANTGTLTETTGATFSSVTKLFNWQNTIYGSDSDSQVFTKLYLPDTDVSPSSESGNKKVGVGDITDDDAFNSQLVFSSELWTAAGTNRYTNISFGAGDNAVTIAGIFPGISGGSNASSFSDDGIFTIQSLVFLNNDVGAFGFNIAGDTNNMTTSTNIKGAYFVSNGTDLFAQVATGAARTQLNLGSSYFSDRARLRIEFDRVNATPQARFYVNGSLLATLTTNLPATSIIGAVYNNNAGSFIESSEAPSISMTF